MIFLAYKYNNVNSTAKVTLFIELTKEKPNYLEISQTK